MRLRTSAPSAAFLLLLALPSSAVGQRQDSWYQETHDWCVQHHPCDWGSHAAATGVTSGLLGAATGIDARWFAAGWTLFFIGKEIRDGARWGWQGKDASKIAPLPRPLDAAIDLTVTLASAIWLAPAVDRWISGGDSAPLIQGEESGRHTEGAPAVRGLPPVPRAGIICGLPSFAVCPLVPSTGWIFPSLLSLP